MSLEAMAKLIESLRTDLLFGENTPEDLGPMSEQHFLSALAHLELAQRSMTLATYWRARKD